MRRHQGAQASASVARLSSDYLHEVLATDNYTNIQRVTRMAYAQVTDFGMSRSVGPLSFAKDGDNTLYKPFSERTARMIDHEAEKIVSGAYDRSLKLLRDYRPQLNELAERLLEKEVIGTDELVRILGPRREMPPDALPTPSF